MKFYMHCEDPELTVVMMWDAEKVGTVQDVLVTFKESLKKKCPSYNREKVKLSCTIRNANGKTLDNTSAVCKVVKHMDDLYVKVEATEAELTAKTVAKAVDKASTEAEESGPNKDVLLGRNNAAVIHIGNGRYRKAVEIYREMLKIDSRNKTALKGLVSCYKRAGRFDKALIWAKKGLKLFENDVEMHMFAGESYVGCRNGDSALEILMKCSKLARSSGGLKTEEKHEVQVLIAKAYLLKDETDMAIAVLQGILRENIEHEEALVEYTGLLFPLGPSQSEEALSALLTILARNKNDSNAKEKFAWICRQPTGMEVLNNVAGRVMGDATALVYLANCLRDCSAIEESLKLLCMALDIDPGNPSIALLYVHNLEVIDRHKDIIHVYKKYCNQFPDQTIGEISCSKMNDIVQSIQDELCIKHENELACKPHVDHLVHSTSRDYTDEEKYLLAFWFTLVKVLFVKGLLEYICPLLEMLQPLYEGQQLHLSNIRNEAAYFNCISALFKLYPQISATNPLTEDNYVYFIGDSHCIPPAWQKISIQDCTYTVYPVLSTGTKIWHLRADGNFYPKKNFNSVVRNIPDNAIVVVCLGEIDCREALLKCWEKARYDTIEDGMETLINIYLDALKTLQDKHQWKIFLHPVSPVLDITRPIVMQFNRILATKLLTEPTLHWLNFVRELVTGAEQGEVLKEEFRFDGTHLHPRYVSLLAQSLSQFY